MNRLALKTDLARRFDLNVDATFLNELITTGESWVWNYAEWRFKNPQPVAAPTVQAQGYVQLPADVRRVITLFDDQGDPLDFMPRDEFQRTFRYQLTQGQTAKPSAFTTYDDDTASEGLRAIFDVKADQVYNFTVEYERKLCSRTAAGAVQVGPMQLDTDTPFWGAEHHQVIVFAAALDGLVLDNDPTYPPLQSSRDEKLAAMEVEYLDDTPLVVPSRVWGPRAGRRRWGR